MQLSSASIPLREPRSYVSLSQSLLDVVAQAGNELRSVLYEISPAFNLSRGYVVISVQDTAWKPETLTYREYAISRGSRDTDVYKNPDAISDMYVGATQGWDQV